MVQTRLYRTGELEREDVAFNELDDLVRQEGVTVWVDYTSPTPDDLAGIERYSACTGWPLRTRSTTTIDRSWTGTPPTCSLPPTTQNSVATPTN